MSQSTHLDALSTLLKRDDMTSGVTKRELQILALLVAHKTPMSRSTIGELTGIDGTWISRIVRKMAKEGYLSRTEHPNDGRIWLIQPTAKGIEMDKRVRKLFDNSKN